MLSSSTPSTPAPLLSDAGRTPSTRSNSSGELEFDKSNKAVLKHLSQSRLEVDESVVRAEGEDRTTAFVWWLVIAAATGGLLFGYDVRFYLRLVPLDLVLTFLPLADRCHRWRSRSRRHRNGLAPQPAP